MDDTHFVNCTGLDDGADAASHRTSAWDIALMSRELLKNHPDIKKFTTIWMDTVRGGAFGLSNTNKLVRFYPGCTGLKTGFTSGAGYCLSASAQRDGMELIAVVMGCETSNIRTAACKAMLDYGFANYALITPEVPENCAVPVALGTEKTVTAVPGNLDGLLIPKGQKSGITTRLDLEPSVTAPVSRGQRLGTLTVLSGEQVLSQIPLVAAEGVPRLTWSQLLGKILRQIAMARET
jgi:D-alanyl-D-alanine carboxypeptidase (penicillin-binding protein 5/6)